RSVRSAWKADRTLASRKIEKSPRSLRMSCEWRITPSCPKYFTLRPATAGTTWLTYWSASKRARVRQKFGEEGSTLTMEWSPDSSRNASRGGTPLVRSVSSVDDFAPEPDFDDDAVDLHVPGPDGSVLGVVAG